MVRILGTKRFFFHAEVDQTKEPFCIVIPPPNITGELHMGHALDNTLQDILVRWKRMDGFNTVWIPALITPASPHRLGWKITSGPRKARRATIWGREEFLRRTWAWREKYGDRILNQLKKLGASPDWERERFTLDEGCSRAVREVFVRLFEKGLIYQGHYSVNWCPNCSTTLSDIEVEHEEGGGQAVYDQIPFG